MAKCKHVWTKVKLTKTACMVQGLNSSTRVKIITNVIYKYANAVPTAPCMGNDLICGCIAGTCFCPVDKSSIT